jgi:hypothetical protein
MIGIDPGQVAQQFITYFGGAAGGYIVAAAVLIITLLAVAHIVDRRAPWITLALGIFAWTSAYVLRTVIGWA